LANWKKSVKAQAATELQKRANLFSLSPGERAGVRAVVN
jgi:hypothetical protein